MNGKSLLMGLDYIHPKFIEESETDTLKSETIPHQLPRRRRLLLIAAIIALLLVLVGCAAVCVSVLFGSPKDMISALYGENAGFSEIIF